MIFESPFKRLSTPTLLVMLFALPVSGQGKVPVLVPGSNGSATAAERQFRGEAYPLDAPGLIAPTLRHREEARYTPKALSARLQGTVDVEIVISADGAVDRARVAKSLDPKLGLDEAALKAAKGWTFDPAQLGGRPVAVFGVVQLSFKIH